MSENKFELLFDDVFRLHYLHTHIGITIYKDFNYNDSLYVYSARDNALQFLKQTNGKYSIAMWGNLYFNLKRYLESNNLVQNLNITFSDSYDSAEGFDYNCYDRRPIVINDSNKILMNVMIYVPDGLARMLTIDLEESLSILHCELTGDYNREYHEAHQSICELLLKFGSNLKSLVFTPGVMVTLLLI